MGLSAGLVFGLPACATECVTKTGNPGDSCGGAGAPLPDLPTDSAIRILAKQCGLNVDCEGGGIAEGNASISGIPSIDAFFRSVVNLQTREAHVTSALISERAAIAAAFGIAADADLASALEAQIEANVSGALSIDLAPVQCRIDGQLALDAHATCDGELSSATAGVECAGSCEITPTAEASCQGPAKLSCTFVAAASACEGDCAGSCDLALEQPASCDGRCTGSCDGECSRYSDAAATQCDGTCDGMCEGRCELEFAAPASCGGRCNGECTVSEPQAGCEGASRAECVAERDASVMCAGRCQGEVTPPSAKFECEVSAAAEAKMRAECKPPRVVVHYRLAADLDPQAAARFEAGMRVLQARLPGLLAATLQAELLAEVGADLVKEAGGGALQVGINASLEAAQGSDLRALFGLRCAIEEAGAIPATLAPSLERLDDAIVGVAELTRALGVK